MSTEKGILGGNRGGDIGSHRHWHLKTPLGRWPSRERASLPSQDALASTTLISLCPLSSSSCQLIPHASRTGAHGLQQSGNHLDMHCVLSTLKFPAAPGNHRDSSEVEIRLHSASGLLNSFPDFGAPDGGACPLYAGWTLN